VDSRNPSLVSGAPGESEVARVLAEILRTWRFDVELQQVEGTRANVVARARGAEGGRSLMLNGHLDTVGIEAMTHAPFDGEIRDGRLYGRGSNDIKAGVAAMCAAAVRAVDRGIAGEIVIAGVVDEEFSSIGTSALVARGVRADAALVTEPTGLAIMPAHKGFAWLEVTVHGRAAHGSRHELGIDAIRHAGLLLAELDRIDADVLPTHAHALLGHASLHAATIEGGVGWSTYPDRCVLRIERRTVPGERAEDALRELEDACARVASRVSSFRADVALTFSQEPSDVAADAPVVRDLAAALEDSGERVAIEGMSAWTDAAILNAAGIPAICFGPGDIALAHAAEEYVDVREIERAAMVMERMIGRWCGPS
jgi:acetylornithine deacetylase